MQRVRGSTFRTCHRSLPVRWLGHADARQIAVRSAPTPVLSSVPRRHTMRSRARRLRAGLGSVAVQTHLSALSSCRVHRPPLARAHTQPMRLARGRSAPAPAIAVTLAAGRRLRAGQLDRDHVRGSILSRRRGIYHESLRGSLSLSLSLSVLDPRTSRHTIID